VARVSSLFSKSLQIRVFLTVVPSSGYITSLSRQRSHEGDWTAKMGEYLSGISVLIPACNEEQSVRQTVEEIHETLVALGKPFEIVVIDDGSTDGTAEKASEAKCRLVQHSLNRGYGASLKTGAAEARFDVLVMTDADGTYPNKEIPRLLEALEEVDMVVGARTGQKVQIPLLRRPAKWMITRLANYLSGHKIPDLNSGLRAIRRPLWDRYLRFFPDGFSLTTTITLAALTNGHRVNFIPVDYHTRSGKSKIRPIRDTINFVSLIVRTVLYFEPLKVFVPVSLALFLAGFIFGGTTFVLHHFFEIGLFWDTTTVLLVLASIQLLAIGALADLITKRF
jgi:glycosyltransferase involved in cell wall biosynthesis